MILSNEEADSRLDSKNNLANKFGKGSKVTVLPYKNPGRKPEVQNLPIEEREEISLRANLGEKQTELAKEFNTSQVHVSQLENFKDKSIDKGKIRNSLDSVRDEALEKLMVSMGLLTKDKMRKLKATELSQVAKTMSGVVRDLTPEVASGTAVQVVVYAPELRKEENFDSKEI